MLILKPDNFVVIDTETTGSDRFRDSIISVAAIKYDNKFNVIDEYSTFIKYNGELSEEITQLTGITTSQVNDVSLPTIDEVIEKLQEFISDVKYIAGYNQLTFDNIFLKRFGLDLSQHKMIDVYQYVQFYNPFNTDNLKLETLANTLHLTQDHSALNDCKLTVKIYQTYIDKVNQLNVDDSFGQVLLSWSDILIDTAKSANNDLKLYVGTNVNITKLNTCNVEGAHPYFVKNLDKRLMSMFTDDVNTIKLLKSN